jgi:hypothetical protein
MVRISKIAEAENPKVKSADWEKFVCGTDNGDISLPVDYWMLGDLVTNIRVGEPILLRRHSRNGVKSEGRFMSSKVVGITQPFGGSLWIVQTENSVYAVRKL